MTGADGGATPDPPRDTRCAPAERDETVAALLHDLNQPLTALTNFLAAAQVAIGHDAKPDAIGGLVDGACTQAARARLIARRLREHIER